MSSTYLIFGNGFIATHLAWDILKKEKSVNVVGHKKINENILNLDCPPAVRLVVSPTKIIKNIGTYKSIFNRRCILFKIITFY